MMVVNHQVCLHKVDFFLNNFCWSNFTAEEREPYLEQSRADKQRYEQESAAYRGAAAQQGPGDGSEGRL